jgi:hypothetical protein
LVRPLLAPFPASNSGVGWRPPLAIQLASVSGEDANAADYGAGTQYGGPINLRITICARNHDIRQNACGQALARYVEFFLN